MHRHAWNMSFINESLKNTSKNSPHSEHFHGNQLKIIQIYLGLTRIVFVRTLRWSLNWWICFSVSYQNRRYDWQRWQSPISKQFTCCLNLMNKCPMVVRYYHYSWNNLWMIYQFQNTLCKMTILNSKSMSDVLQVLKCAAGDKMF